MKHRNIGWTLAVSLALAAFTPSHAGPPTSVSILSEPAAEKAALRLRTFMEEKRIPGLSIAVGQDGEVIWAEGFGLADLESAVPVTTSSRFPLGSTTKVLVSAALGKLVQEGKLDLDAPVQQYVPYFPEKAGRITARLLAGHLAGLRNYDMAAGEYANTRHFESVKEAVTVFQDSPLLFEPGTGYQYSAYNFVLLSAAIEGASGSDFLTYLKTAILDPLGLERTGPNRQPAPMPGLVTGYAVGFFGVPGKAPFTDLSNKWAAGGYVSTPTEMVRFGNALLQGEIVDAETLTLLTTAQRLNDGSDTGAGYAMGWRSGSRLLPDLGREVRTLHHGGLGNGSISFLVLFPEERLVISMQGNLLFEPFSDFGQELFEVADLFLQVEASKKR